MSASLKGSLVLLACSLSLAATAAPQHTQPRPVQPPPHRPATSRHVAPPTTAPAHVVAATQPRFEAPEEPPLLIPKDPAEALAAARDARAEKPADAYRIYKHLVKTAPLSDEGQAATKEAAAMEKDPAVAKKVMDSHAEAKAAAALSMADNFLAAGLIDKAKQRYQTVITEYPDTMCAVVAKERLAKAATAKPATPADAAK
jgi:hypothetical protein